MTEEREAFLQVAANGLKVLVAGLLARLESCMSAMTRMPW
jgi:hypothetical protein